MSKELKITRPNKENHFRDLTKMVDTGSKIGSFY